MRARTTTTMTEYLASAPVIATRSVEAAQEAVGRTYLRHELVRIDGAIDMRLNTVASRHLTLGYLTYQAETQLTMPRTEDSYIVNLTVEGRTMGTRRDGARVATVAGAGGLVLSPLEAHRVRWSRDAEQLHLKIPRTGLESHLADMLGRPVDEVVDFEFGLDLTAPAGQALLRSVQFLAAELDRPAGLAAMPLARAQLEAYVLSALLQAGRHQFSDALAGREDVRRLGPLAPVVEHIEAHADAALTPEILARVGCVSVRTLHAAFRERLGTTPMAYVRSVRLDHARAALLRGDPGNVSVSEIALRFGFVHLSRFAEQYRSRFGELPSVTLHR
jgi:AraC-like DNA-binding protein